MFEYNMTKTMANNLLKSRKGSEKNLEPQKYLVKIVNEQFNLLYPVTKVSVNL